MGYGKIYNTSWWGNALDTARTAGTEPDFFGSQMKLLTSNQPELVTNGDFATDSDWVKGTGWTISGGKASRTAQSGSTACDQIISLTANKTYKIVYNLTLDAGTFNVRFTRSTSVNGETRTSSGTYTDYLKGENGNNTFRLIGSDSNFIGSIDNVSIKEVRLELDQIEAKKCLADWIHVTALQDLNN